MTKSNLSYLVVVFSAVAMTACGPSGNKPNVEIIQDMMESPAIKAQEYDESSPNHSGARVPADKTIPVGFTPYKYAADYDGAVKNLRNPISDKMDAETLLTGQKYYETHCTVCHGSKGEGGEAAKSVVSEKMGKKPPSLLSEKVTDWNDAQVYHVITMGQGLMGPYASHIPQQYRWQVVNYIRHLQKQNK